MYDLTTEEIECIREIIRKTLPHCEIRVFGSRQKACAKQHSDLDIALVCNGKISWLAIETIKEDLLNADLRINVDVVDWHRLTDEFQQIILSEYSVLE